MMLFVYSTPTAALNNLRASTSADRLHLQEDGVVLPYWLTTYQCNRNSFNGEAGIILGNEVNPIWVYALGRAVPAGQATLTDATVVKIWDEFTETILASVEVGPNSAIQNGYAMENLSSALYLPVGDYRLSQNTWRGMDPWPDQSHAPARGNDVSSALTFRGACYARRAGMYPRQTDGNTRRAGMLQLNFARTPAPAATTPTATTASATYVIGGGYHPAAGRSADTSCGAVGHQDITTLHECQSAVQQVGIAIIETVGPGTWHHVPYGCTVQQGSATPESGAVGIRGRVHFSTTPGDNNGGSGGYVLICKQAAVLSDAPTGRIAVFSAQFGGRDRVQYKLSQDTLIDETGDDWISIEGFNRWTEASDHIGEKLPHGVDAFLFTDMINVGRNDNSPWQFVYPARQFEELCDDNVLCLWKGKTNLTRSQKHLQLILASKFFKMRWIAQSTEYDYIVWMDGKYLMTNPMLTETIHKYMGDSVDMLAMRHPTRKTVAQELGPASERAAQILHDNASYKFKQANEAYERYKHEGFSDAMGLFDSAMFVVRPARVHDMFIDWWHEVQQGIPRDQISLPWMIQKHGINIYSIGHYPCAVLGENCQNPQAHSR
jgi:hypothetical protein